MISVKTLSDNEFITYEKFFEQQTAAEEAGVLLSDKIGSMLPMDNSGRF